MTEITVEADTPPAAATTVIEAPPGPSENDVRIEEVRAERETDIAETAADAATQIAEVEAAARVAISENDTEWLRNQIAELQSTNRQQAETIQTLTASLAALAANTSPAPLIVSTPPTSEEVIPTTEADPAEIKTEASQRNEDGNQGNKSSGRPQSKRFNLL